MSRPLDASRTDHGSPQLLPRFQRDFVTAMFAAPGRRRAMPGVAVFQADPVLSKTISRSGLEVIGAGCDRGGRSLFRDVTFSVGAGCALWLRGRNGSGKTSLLRVLAGLAVPQAGRILWQGRPLGLHGQAALARLYIGHTNALKEDLTAREALAFLVRLHGGQVSPASIGEALATFGMESRANAAVRTLSQGQRRRVALARLVLQQRGGDAAGLWLLDEPFDALDQDGIAALGALLAGHVRQRGAIVLTSHQRLDIDRCPFVTFDLDTREAAA